MATALVAASLLSGAGAATAGVTGATIAGMSAGTLAAVSAGIGAVSSVYGGMQQQRMYEMQAKQTEFQALQDRTQRAVEEETRQRQIRRTIASQNALFGSGVASLNSGSINAVQRDTLNQGRRESRMASLQGSINDTTSQFNASQQRMAGRNALLGSFTTATNSLISVASMNS